MVEVKFLCLLFELQEASYSLGHWMNRSCFSVLFSWNFYLLEIWISSKTCFPKFPIYFYLVFIRIRNSKKRQLDFGRWLQKKRFFEIRWFHTCAAYTDNNAQLILPNRFSVEEGACRGFPIECFDACVFGHIPSHHGVMTTRRHKAWRQRVALSCCSIAVKFRF